MTTLQELKDVAQQTPAFAFAVTHTLALATDVATPEMVNYVVQDFLPEYFGSDDRRQAIRVTVDGEKVGYLLRADLFNYVAATTRGIGSGDGAGIPGDPRSFLIHLRCPVAGCPEEMWAVRMPVYCSIDGTAMVIAP